MVSSIIVNAESSINTMSGLANDVRISQGKVEGARESESLKLGITVQKAEEGVVSFLTYIKHLSIDS